MSYDTFQKAITQGLKEPSGGKSFSVASGETSPDHKVLFKLFDRSEELQKLNKIINSSHTAGQWVSEKAKMEFMAGMERDVRNRYRTRMQHYIAGTGSKTYLSNIMARHDIIVQQIDQ